MLHPGQALSRTQIGEHVWGYDFFNELNIVDVYIGDRAERSTTAMRH